MSDAKFHAKALGGMVAMPGAPVFFVGWVILGFPLILCLVAALVFPALYSGLLTVDRALEPARKRKRVISERNAALEKAKQDSDLAVWRMMTHLTAADERWLAERHHYVVPKEVARLRAGLEHDETPSKSKHSGKFAPPVQNRLDMKDRAKKARKEFQGTALVEGANAAPQHVLDSFQTELPANLRAAASDIRMALDAKKQEDQAKELESKKEMAKQARRVDPVQKAAQKLREALDRDEARRTGEPVEGTLVDPPHRTRGSR